MSGRKTKRRVGDHLRILAENMRSGYDSADYPMDEGVAFEWYCRMRVAADLIDAEHEQRMEDQRRSYRRLIDG